MENDKAIDRTIKQRLHAPTTYVNWEAVTSFLLFSFVSMTHGTYADLECFIHSFTQLKLSFKIFQLLILEVQSYAEHL